MRAFCWPRAVDLRRSGCLGILSEEVATTSPTLLDVSVADQPAHVNFFSGGELLELIGIIGINVPTEWELRLQMCGTQCDVVFAPP